MDHNPSGDVVEEVSELESHPAFGGIIAAIDLSHDDWQQLNDKGYVTVLHHRESHGGEAVIELTIKAPVGPAPD
jgi:hypothetical protein